MSHSKQPASRDGKGLFVLVVICVVFGIGVGSMMIDQDQDRFELAIYAGGALTVLGIGYGFVIKNSFRVLLFALGGFGLGLLLRGFATML